MQKPAFSSRGDKLLAIARSAIGAQWGEPSAPQTAPWLLAPGATFVTLMLDGRLRGCMGSVDPRRPLAADVAANARAAAFSDPRFEPLGQAEFDSTGIEISLLSPREALRFDSEADVIAQLRPGTDGLLFECGPHRSTFLPQVWAQLPHPAAFLAQLKQKAGLDADFWSADVRVNRYTVLKWAERDHAGRAATGGRVDAQ